MKPLRLGAGSWVVTVQRRWLRWHGEVYHSGYGWASTRAWSRRELKRRCTMLIGEFEVGS